MKEICIIGGGAAGLTAAITIARRGKKVTIIESMDKCGKKLSITGNGRCNYYNENQKIEKYHSNNPELIKKIITQENLEKVNVFFNSLGIIPTIKDGYYYPFSKNASTILNALIYEAKRLNVEIINNVKVEKIIKKDFYIINPDKEKIEAKKIIITTGSKAAPKTGSDGSGYDLAMNLGHKIIKPTPSLVSLKGNENYFKKWSGVRTEVILSFEKEGSIIKENGEIQLTDQGISGIVTFNMSNHVTKGDIIKINFLPFVKEDKKNWIKKLKKLNYPINETLERILNYKLVNVIIKKTKLQTNDFNKLTDKELNNLINNLFDFEFKVTELGSFDKAQVCKGGIPLTEININTFESQIVKNLYFAGEIIDINGDCGGYNLTFAWISGIKVGENIW